VTVAADGFSSALPDTIGNVSSGAFGVREQSPAQWVIAQVGADVATVRVRFGDGGTDQMKPERGVAVLAHRGDTTAATVETVDASGKVTNSETNAAPACADPSCPTGTVPPFDGIPTPPTLPAPGPQPADVAGARAAVTAAFAGAFDGSTSNDEKARAIEGGGSLIAVFDELRNGPVGASVKKATTVVEEIVFVSPTHAAVRFHSQLGPDGGISGPYLGDAILTASGWQMTRDSFCSLALLAGAKCP
jgi:hypothetical protein